jgi:hypothetical protein
MVISWYGFIWTHLVPCIIYAWFFIFSPNFCGLFSAHACVSELRYVLCARARVYVIEGYKQGVVEVDRASWPHACMGDAAGVGVVCRHSLDSGTKKKKGHVASSFCLFSLSSFIACSCCSLLYYLVVLFIWCLQSNSPLPCRDIFFSFNGRCLRHECFVLCVYRYAVVRALY